MKIWVDDERPAPSGWFTCENAEVAIMSIDSYWGIITNISLDNDLGEGGTGEDVMRFIESLIADRSRKKSIPTITCHSANPVAKKRIDMAIARL